MVDEMKCCNTTHAFMLVAASFSPSGHPVLSQIDVLVGAKLLGAAGQSGIEPAGVQQLITFPFLSFHRSPQGIPWCWCQDDTLKKIPKLFRRGLLGAAEAGWKALPSQWRGGFIEALLFVTVDDLICISLDSNRRVSNTSLTFSVLHDK